MTVTDEEIRIALGGERIERTAFYTVIVMRDTIDEQIGGEDGEPFADDAAAIKQLAAELQEGWDAAGVCGDFLVAGRTEVSGGMSTAELLRRARLAAAAPGLLAALVEALESEDEFNPCGDNCGCWADRARAAIARARGEG